MKAMIAIIGLVSSLIGAIVYFMKRRSKVQKELNEERKDVWKEKDKKKRISKLNILIQRVTGRM